MRAIIDAYCTLGNERETALSANALLKLMDGAGIDRAVVAPDDREIAVNNRTGNRRILDECQRSGGRFIPSCAINPWYGQGGCDELRAAVDAGARMFVLAPALQGFCLSDPVTDEILGVAAELRVPIYVHTGPHSGSAPTQLILVAAKHPTAQFIMGHCGSTDYAHDMPAVLQCSLTNVWFELSLARPWVVANYCELGGFSRLIFASSAPRNDPDLELRHFRKYLSVETHAAVFGDNIIRLLEEIN